LPSRFKLTLACGVIAAALVTLAPASGGASAAAAGSSTSPTPSTTDQLKAERAALVQQLATALGARNDAKGQLVAAQGQLSTVQKQLADSHKQLDAVNAHLKTLSLQIAGDEQSLNAARAQLGAMVRVAYETSDKDGFAGAVLSANDFGQAMDRIRSAQNITDQVANLQAQITAKEKSLLDERTTLQSQAADASKLEEQLNQESGMLMALVGQRDLAFNRLSGPARDLAARIAAIDDQLSPPPPAPPITSSGTCGNRFAFGYCTWYVATRRCIPWLGNAWDWWRNAAAMGYAEGQVPERGAVVVWGRSGSSPDGHVAYVEAVGPDGGVPAGSFLVSEMNYRGWDQVDYRTVKIGSPGILGFIYGRAG
jgi:surface antigen/peptidoglycan hydrolase CwlO-like protein